MSRRARAIGFGIAALACAGLAAGIANSYRGSVVQQFGPLRPVAVATGELPRGEPLGPADVRTLLTVRRVPAEFAPADALASPDAAVGLAPVVSIPAGDYLLSGMLHAPGSHGQPGPAPRVAPGRRPVELTVTGAGALAVTGRDPVGMRVDVVVTTEPRGAAGSGRTYVAARGVRVLGLAEGADAGAADPLAPGGWAVTLALTRPQALRLIQAETYARSVRLIAAG